MSSSNAKRTRAQKHQNSFAFKPGLHGLTPQQKSIQNLEISGVCGRCEEILQWKIKYDKFKPLTVPAKCTKCGERTVKKAYHILCTNCSSASKLCPKCGKVPPKDEPTQQATSCDL